MLWVLLWMPCRHESRCETVSYWSRGYLSGLPYLRVTQKAQGNLPIMRLSVNIGCMKCKSLQRVVLPCFPNYGVLALAAMSPELPPIRLGTLSFQLCSMTASSGLEHLIGATSAASALPPLSATVQARNSHFLPHGFVTCGRHQCGIQTCGGHILLGAMITVWLRVEERLSLHCQSR
ncbi:hypothetical protein TREES_T100014259 [Tupaia chinensis]|uniref:Uncharacterized protein n=1 Tax=Tupaia chinensis TaxID=246437 RepID=L9JF07_TUPCH|nr:hypothetical protein TREES_T100014259 [Tupaia chinensis]